MQTELEEFSRCWELQTEGTIALMRSLPRDKYSYRPDSGGRSMGELAWHLAEIEAYVTLGIEHGEVRLDLKPPHIERPQTVEELAPAFGIVHDDATAYVVVPTGWRPPSCPVRTHARGKSSGLNQSSAGAGGRWSGPAFSEDRIPTTANFQIGNTQQVV